MEEEGTGIVIDVKYAKNGNFEQGCREAMEQIEKMGYGASLLEDGMERVLKYGILDEPTAAPDPKGEAKVYEMFYRLHFRMQAQKEANMVPAIPPTRIQPLRSRKRHSHPRGVYFCRQESFSLSVPKKRIHSVYPIPHAMSGEHRALHFRMSCPH